MFDKTMNSNHRWSPTWLVKSVATNGFIYALSCAGLTGTAFAQAPTRDVVPTAATQEFNFVVLGDSQFHQPLVFNRLINNVAQMRPGFVVQVGDMIEGYADVATARSQWQRFARQIAPLTKVDFIPVPGNHDLYGSDKKANGDISALYEDIWGRQYRSFEYHKSLFVVLNTDAVDEERSIGPRQFRWLAKTLASAKRTAPKFVFMHRPPDLLENADDLHQLFAKHSVNTVFYGHHHHLHSREQDGVRYLMTNAAANSAVAATGAGSFPHFIHVNVRDGAAHVAVVKADSIVTAAHYEPDANYDLMQLTRNFAPSTVVLTPSQTRLTSSPTRFTSSPTRFTSSPTRFTLDISLRNNSGRTVQILPYCSSADDRWTFTPILQPSFEVTSNAVAEFTVQATANFELPGESTPHCTFTLPFQLSSGEWYDHKVIVKSTLPTSN